MGEQHEQAVDRLKAIIRSVGGQIKENYWGPAGQGGFKLPLMQTDKGPREWILDVCAVHNRRLFAAEADGTIGHTGRGKVKDDFRDWFLKEYFGIDTFRFPTPYLVGKTALKDDRLFLEEMHLI